MKIVLVDVDYRDYDTVVNLAGEPIEVDEDEYELIKNYFTVRKVMDKEFLLSEAKKRQEEDKARRLKYEADNEMRAAKAAATAEKRKLKQLEKLKKELNLD